MTEALLQPLDVDAVAQRLAEHLAPGGPAHGRLTPEEATSLWNALHMQVVLPMIQRLEERLDCDTLGEEAEHRLPTRLGKYDRSKGRFVRWLEKTLVNIARDILRKRRRVGIFGVEDPNQIADAPPETDDTPAPSLDERLATALSELRSALNELDQRPRARQQKTDYHAILLLSLRLALAARMRGHRTLLQGRGLSRSQMTHLRMAWSAGEQIREIQPGWPKLQTVWQVIGEELDRTDDLLTDDDVVRLLTPLPGVVGLTSVAWRQWRTRATQAAGEFLGTERWDRTVARWL